MGVPMSRLGQTSLEPLESRMMGNYHVRFLGGKAPERELNYPIYNGIDYPYTFYTS